MPSRVCLLHAVACCILIDYIIAVDFFIAAVASPITSEMAAVTRNIPGIGCKFTCHLSPRSRLKPVADAHTYGSFNILLGLGQLGEFLPRHVARLQMR